MERIYKYQPEAALHNNAVAIKLPLNHELLEVDLQNGVPTIWALVEESKHSAYYYVYPTGAEVDRKIAGTHIKTLISPAGFVWHVFQEGFTI